MKKFIIEILSASLLYCKYSELFIDKLEQLTAYKMPVKEISKDSELAVVKINESVIIEFKLSETGYVTAIDCHDA